MRLKIVKPKIVQVPVDAAFLERIDTGAAIVKESRAQFVREACELRLKRLKNLEAERRYRAGYESVPDDPAWAQMSSAALADQLPEEDW
jgi:metal-responsive CopG/Arc/MetJ family transcriptional regulator